MSPLSLEEFFRERPTRARDLFHAGLALSGLGVFLKLMSLGVPIGHAREVFVVVVGCLGLGIASLIGSEVTRRRRRWGFRATRDGLSEVFGPEQERFWEWKKPPRNPRPWRCR